MNLSAYNLTWLDLIQKKAASKSCLFYFKLELNTSEKPSS